MDESEVDGMLAELTETYMSRIDEVATSAADKAVVIAEKRLEEKLMALMPKSVSENIGDLNEQYDELKASLEKSNEERARIAVELERNHKKHLEVAALYTHPHPARRTTTSLTLLPPPLCDRTKQTLHEALVAERGEAAVSNEAFEAALQAKYDTMVNNFQERVKREQENRLKRSMEDVERSARKESERYIC